MKLQIGRKYVTRSGKTRLLEPTTSPHHFGDADGWHYFEDGHIWSERNDDCEDIVAEYVSLPDGIPQPPLPPEGNRWSFYKTLANQSHIAVAVYYNGKWEVSTRCVEGVFINCNVSLVAVPEDADDLATPEEAAKVRDAISVVEITSSDLMDTPQTTLKATVPKETLPQPPAPPSGKKWVEYKEGPKRKEWISWNGRNWRWNCPGTNALMAVPLTRYFRHTTGFADTTDYVELNGDVATAVSKTGERCEMMSKTKEVLGFVRDGLWVEVEKPDSSDTLLETTLNSLEKLEAVNVRLREELVEVRDDWHKDHMEMKRKYDADLFHYGEFVTNVAKAVGRPTHSISLKDTLDAVNGLVEIRDEQAQQIRILEHSYKEARLERDAAVADAKAAVAAKGFIVAGPCDDLSEVSKLICDLHRASMEISNWHDTAAQFSRDISYYQGLLDHVAVLVGQDAFTCDDGSVVNSPLRDKVPEAVAKVMLRLKEFENDCFQDTDPQTCCGNDH